MILGSTTPQGPLPHAAASGKDSLTQATWALAEQQYIHNLLMVAQVFNSSGSYQDSRIGSEVFTNALLRLGLQNTVPKAP